MTTFLEDAYIFGVGIVQGIAKGIKPLNRKRWQQLWNNNRRRRHIVNALNRTKERSS